MQVPRRLVRQERGEGGAGPAQVEPATVNMPVIVCYGADGYTTDGYVADGYTADR